MITIEHLRKLGVLKRQIQIAKEVSIEQTDRLIELERAMEALAYQIIEDNRND